MQKRGQITIFIIIGLLLVFSSGLVFFIRNQTTQDRMDAQLKQSASRVPLSVLPVKEFVDNCLREVSIEALNYVGQHGGYYNFSKFRKDDTIDTESIKDIPFWYYIKDCASRPYGCGNSLQPTLDDSGEDSMVTEIENYIDDNLPRCINNFRTFDNQYTSITIDADPKSTVLVRDKDVYFKLNFPITIQNNKDTTKAQDFVQSVKVDLKGIYSFAADLVESESETGFLEKDILNLMAPYRGDELPPFYEMKQGADADPSRGWFFKDVKATIENDILEQMVQMIRFSNTNTAIPGGLPQTVDSSMQNEITSGFWSSMSKAVGTKRYDNLLVEVEYPRDSYYLSLNDGEQYIRGVNLFDAVGGSGSTQIITMLFSPFMLVYRTSYDMVVPVIVTVTDLSADKASFNSQGYSFSFAMELNIRNNKEYNDKVTLSVPESTKGRYDLVAERNMFPKKNFTISVYDMVAKKNVAGAYVESFCGRKFGIGSTDMDGVLSTRLPSCSVGGKLKVTKTGYVSDPVNYRNDMSDDSSEIRIPVWPIVKKELRVKKIATKELITGDLPVDVAIDAMTGGVSAIIKGTVKADDLESMLKSYSPETASQIKSTVGSPTITTFNDKVKKYQISTALYGLVKSAGESVGASFAPWGTVIVAAINVAEMILQTQGLEFPIPTEDYKEDLLKSGYYSLVDVIDTLNDEQVIVVIDRQGLPLSTRVPMVNVITVNDSDAKYTVELVPGNYTIDMTLLYTKNVTFPKQHVCGEVEFINSICDKFGVNGTIENKTLPSWLEAHQKINVIISPDDLYKDENKYLDVYVISAGLPSGWFDLPTEEMWTRMEVLRNKWISGLTSQS